MPPAPDLASALADAASLARVAERTARAESARAVVRQRGHEAGASEASDRAADLRLRASLLRRIPGLGFLRRGVTEREADARARGAEARAAAAREARVAEDLAGLATRVADARAKVVQAAAGMPSMGGDPESVAAARSCAGRIRALRQGKPVGEDPGGAWVREAERAVMATLGAAAEAAAAHDRERRRRVEREARQREAGHVPRARRLYLPIPRSLDAAAARAGAFRDADAPQGASPWFVPPGSPLGPFRNLLPLAARPGAAGLSFPPVPMKAAGQNLWGILDQDSWGHIRRQAYAAAGRRCVICGGRSGGFLAERLYEEGERRHPIECHEVWDWRIPRESDGIGVQSLRKLLVVCRDCHPMFHSGFFQRRARELGVAGEVAEAIEKRRMVVNRQTRAEIAADVEAGTETLRRASGVDAWILDLSHLSGQGYMERHPPVVREGNAAGMPPERIAGIAFETDSGREFPARPAREIYQSILAAGHAASVGPRR